MTANNLGYFEFSRGNKSKAVALFEEAGRKSGRGGEKRRADPTAVLAQYNRSVILALDGAVEQAREGFQHVSREAEVLPRRHRKVGALFMLVRSNEGLSIREVRAQPDLGELSRRAIELLDQ